MDAGEHGAVDMVEFVAGILEGIQDCFDHRPGVRGSREILAHCNGREGNLADRDSDRLDGRYERLVSSLDISQLHQGERCNETSENSD